MMRAHAASPARRETLEYECLADMSFGNDKIVDVELVIVLRVRDRRLEALADILRDALARKFKIGERRRNLLAADQARDEVQLLRAHPQHLGDRLCLVLGEAALVRFLAHRSAFLRLQLADGADAPPPDGERFAFRSAEWP